MHVVRTLMCRRSVYFLNKCFIRVYYRFNRSRTLQITHSCLVLCFNLLLLTTLLYLQTCVLFWSLSMHKCILQLFARLKLREVSTFYKSFGGIVLMRNLSLALYVHQQAETKSKRSRQIDKL